MAIAIIVLFWVLVGIGVFFVAIRRGPRARPAGERPSRASRRLTTLGIAALLVLFGIAVPAIVIAAAGNDDAKAKGGVDLSSAQAKGRQVFRKNCATCHTLAATNSVGKVGPSLDVLASVRARPGDAKSTRQAEQFIVDAIRQGRARGQGQMPAEVVQGDEARQVASFVVAVAGRGN